MANAVHRHWSLGFGNWSFLQTHIQAQTMIIRLTFLLSAALLLVGCSGNSDTSYVPKANDAQDAVKLALDAWKNGQTGEPAGKLPSGATVRGIDADWAEGQKLSSYEIVRELPAESAAAPRKLIVKLTYADGSPPQEATYYVVGIDPIQVFRDKDYEKYFGQ